MALGCEPATSEGRPTFRISCEGLVIGYSAFETRGTPRGIVRGAFFPAAGYESVQPLFRRDADACEHTLELPGDGALATCARALFDSPAAQL